MRNRGPCLASLLLLSCSCASASPSPQVRLSTPTVLPHTVQARPELTLTFSDIFVAESRTPELSPKLISAAGKRVRMVGFMAHMDEPPSGAFYLTSRPVSCDEMGAGTGDLPIDSIRVNVVPAPKEVTFVPGPIEVTGVLELGRQEEPDGAVSHIRLVLALPSTSSASTRETHN
jgi:hypothetical protein